MPRIIGAHVSSAGGVVKAVERAAELGCNGVQIFTGSPRMWRFKPVGEYDVNGLEQAKKKWGVEYVVIHAMYLVNLASDKRELVEKSREVLVNDMAICAKAKMAGVVVHLGSHQGRGYEAMRKQLVEEIKKIVDGSPEGSKLLIENSAGQKGKIASELEEVKDLLGAVDSEKLGWCVDTCHCHAAGYCLGKKGEILWRSGASHRTRHAQDDTLALASLASASNSRGQMNMFGGEREKSKMLVEEIEKLGLWESLELVHVNGSRDGFGSGRDRHANLGEGEIADEDMREFVNHEKVKKIPLVLEVPGFEKKGPDRKNVEILKSWLE